MKTFIVDEMSELPEELKAAMKDAVNTLKKLTEQDAIKTEAYQEFKASVGRAMGKAIEVDKIDPFRIVEAMVTLGAITLNCYMTPREGSDPRKTFRKIAGLCYDRAIEIGEIADRKEKAK